jgi:predicted PurR-regulated permease PerM
MGKARFSSSEKKNGLIIIGLILACFLVYYLSNIIAPFLISVVIAYVLNPLVKALVERKFPRPWAVLTVFTIGLVIFTLFIVPFTLSIFSEAGAMIQNMGELDVKKLANKYKDLGMGVYERFSKIPYLKPYLDEFIHSENIREFAAKGVVYVKDGTVSSFKRFMSFLVSAFSGMVNLFLIPILTFYVLLDMDEIFAKAKSLFPPAYKDKITSILGDIDKQLNSLLRGQLTSNAIFALLMTIALWISGLNFFLFLGPLAGVANFIPYLGGLFTIIFAIFIAITQFGFSKALLALMVKLLISVAIVQTIDGWYLQPYVVGENAGLHPLVVMLSLAIAAGVAGIPGMLLAVPVTVILKVLGKELYSELYGTVNA